ncbi:hypothetical protein F1880_008009 [Penicillium rolfsii]|nr:hypothetical protein F1880_008009 [Penicillium rolfsii]
MPSSVSGSASSTPPRGPMVPRSQASPPRPEARSAGMAERPSRNENLSDLVRFFQTTQDVATPGSSTVRTPTSPDSTTALPVVTESIEPKGTQLEMAKEVKPLHRRLLQFTQRPKKESSSKSKLDENQRQIEALQREGYLLPAPKPKSTHSAKTSISSKNSLERTFSKSKKQDVETIGQPWLENDTKTGPFDFKRRLASLDLSDFGSMVDVAVSLSTQVEDASPPPYQPSSSGGIISRGDHPAASQSSPTLPLRSSSASCRSESGGLMSPSTSTEGARGSISQDEHRRQPSTGSNRSTRIPGPCIEPPSQTSTVKPAGENVPASSSLSVTCDFKSDQSAKPAVQPVHTSEKSASSSSGSPASQPSLKLFPDVAPPRMSSKNAWRISSAPQYQRPSNSPSLAGTESPPGASEAKSAKSKPSDVSSMTSKDEGERRGSGATATPAVSPESAVAEISSPRNDAQPKIKSRPPSLAMGTLQAFPLPAPTRPLPTIPQPGHKPPAVPDTKPHPIAHTVRPTLKVPDVHPSHPSPIAEDPYESGLDQTQPNETDTDTRPATALGYVGEAESEADHDNAKSTRAPERPESTSFEQSTPRRRASSICIPCTQDLPESPRLEEFEGTPLADSPLLGQRQMVPIQSQEKRGPRKPLRIDPRMDRNKIPFGLPSPPPTAALPSAPPTQPLPQRPRNYTAPISASVQYSKGMDAQFAAGHHRASMISRSDSSRSSLRHENIPESSEPNRCESPLPSSDDEGFGPSAEATRPNRIAEKHARHLHPLHQGYATVGARASHGHLRYPQPVRTQTPQGRSSRTLEKRAMSPQSTYSQATHRSREPHNSHRTQPHASQVNQYLEERVANLERQNQILQAALLAALNAGVKNPFEGLADSSLPSGFSHLNHANPYQPRFTPRPESWVSSSQGSENSGFETPGSYREARQHVRQLDNMTEDIESGGWMSDKSSRSGGRMARNC